MTTEGYYEDDTENFDNCDAGTPVAPPGNSGYLQRKKQFASSFEDSASSLPLSASLLPFLFQLPGLYLLQLEKSLIYSAAKLHVIGDA